MEEVRYDAGVGNEGHALSGFLVGVRLRELFEHEAGFDDDVQPFRECAMEGGNFEGTPVGFCAMGNGEDPAVDLAISTIEVAPDFDRVGFSFYVTEQAAVGRSETGMDDGELEESSGAEDAVDLLEGLGLIGQIHEAHFRGDEIELRVAEGKFLRAACRISRLTERGCEGEEHGRDVEAEHFRTFGGELAGGVAFAATDVESSFAGYIGEHAVERGRVHGIAIDVPAETREFGPHFGVAVPVAAYFAMIHRIL